MVETQVAIQRAGGEIAGKGNYLHMVDMAEAAQAHTPMDYILQVVVEATTDPAAEVG
jgi:hypothetical protein